MTHIPSTFATGCFVGRAWLPEVAGPSLVTVRNGRVFDITARDCATMRDLLEHETPADVVRNAPGRDIGPLENLLSLSEPDPSRLHLLAPVDFHAVKACGVTFARSMIERVIEERAAGNPARAASIREKVSQIIGASLRDLKAGSDDAQRVKAALIEEGPRIGAYRTGGDQLIVDDKGDSRISFADYAIAMVDELEQHRHSRARFTAAY